MNNRDKKQNNIFNLKDQRGQVAILTVIFFLVIALSVVISISTPLTNQLRTGNDYFLSKQSYMTAETLNDDTLYRLNKGLSLPASISLTLNNSTSNASVNDVNGTKEIVSQGLDNTLTRTIKTVFTESTGVAFNYGLQIGNGGVTMAGGATVNGSVYSNGDINGSGNPSITGTAIVANSASAVADQISSASTTPSNDIIFGTTAATEDFAQAFKVTSSSPLTEVWMYMRQGGSLPNATVLIANDNGGKPGTTLASGTLTSSQVTGTYSWIAVDPTSNPTLTPGTTYWLVIDVGPFGYSASNYFSIGGAPNLYPNGVSKLGKYNGTWNNPSPSTLDSYFQIYLGGNFGSINGVNVGFGGSGSAQAHTVTNSTISGANYCQAGSGNNKSCDTSRTDPSPNSYPMSQANIDDWKAEATSGTNRGTWNISGATNASTTGPMKITGDLNVSGGGTLTLGGTLYVTGNITVSGGAKIKLSSSFGTNAGVVVTDGTIVLSGGGLMNGNGTTGSYLVAITTSSSNAAIDISGGTGSVVLVAMSGTVTMSGGASAKSIVANTMNLSGGTTVTYDTGLANINFSGGPAGQWNLSNWKELAQ